MVGVVFSATWPVCDANKFNVRWGTGVELGVADAVRERGWGANGVLEPCEKISNNIRQTLHADHDIRHLHTRSSTKNINKSHLM